MAKTLIVVPCYNESKRFNEKKFSELTGNQTDLLLVNDGSKDDTLKILERFASQNSGVRVLNLPKNGGKAEAVRQGLIKGVSENYSLIGYTDADLATPPSELKRLLAICQSESSFEIFMASRVKLLGVKIDRRPLRHYLGRVFATLASLVLSIPVYDTQCGAKFFRVSQTLKSAIETPFKSRWIFDVELLSRLLRPRAKVSPILLDKFLEIPLKEWQDVAGSKLTFVSMLKAFGDLLMIYLSQPKKDKI